MKHQIKQVIFVGCLLFHFGLMLCYNLAQCTKVQWDLYWQDDPNYSLVDETAISWIRAMGIFSGYQDITGSNTAFGFYAPQVCGHLEPFFQVYEGEEKILEHYNIALTTAEAALRLEAVFGENLGRLDEIVATKDESLARNTLEYRLLDLKMHSLATRVLNKIGVGDRIEAGLYFYKTSPLSSFCEGITPLLPSYHKTISYDYRTN